MQSVQKMVWMQSLRPRYVQHKKKSVFHTINQDKCLQTQTILSPEASSLLDELRTVDSDPERLASLEKWSGAKLSDADLLELLRRQRGYRTARLFFKWMESQPGVRKVRD